MVACETVGVATAAAELELELELELVFALFRFPEVVPSPFSSSLSWSRRSCTVDNWLILAVAYADRVINPVRPRCAAGTAARRAAAFAASNTAFICCPALECGILFRDSIISALTRFLS